MANGVFNNTAPFVPMPIPEGVFGSTFYNPGQTGAGREELNNFISALRGIFRFTGEDGQIMSEIKKIDLSAEQLQALGLRNVEQTDYSDTLSADQSPADLLEALDAAGDIERVFSEISGTTNSEWKAIGYYDAQLILPFLGAKLSLKVPDGIKLKDYINDLSVESLKNVCARYGVAIEEKKDKDGKKRPDYEGAREGLLKALKEKIDLYSSHFPQLSAEDRERITGFLAAESTTPAIGVVGANIVGRAMHKGIEQAKKAIEESEKKQEQQNKRLAAEDRARKKAQQNEMVKRAAEKSAANKAKGG